MKKSIAGFVLLLFVLFHGQTATSQTQNHQTIVSLGGNAYQIKGNERVNINEKGISSWKNADTEIAVYVSSPSSIKVKAYLNIAKQEKSSKIQIKTNDKVSKIDLKQGVAGKIRLGEVQFKQGYNVLIIKGLNRKGESFVQIDKLILETAETVEFAFVKENSDNRFYWGRRGPSVHLGYTMPENKEIKWFYNELTVPKGKDPIGSYFMANGFGEGYFGIQVNGETERRILFSVWSPFHTDNPNEIPDSEKIKLLKKGEGVKTGEFGNEGSGGQSYKLYNWKAGNTYSFLNSVEPDGKGNTIYTAYFKDIDTGKWMLIASFLRPKTNTWYKHAHSFLENFNPVQGFIERKVLFGNQWVCDNKGEWTELNKARFTGDDIAKVKYRMDREGGSENNMFYLRNGGFFDTKVDLFTSFQRNSNQQKPNIDFDSLP